MSSSRWSKSSRTARESGSADLCVGRQANICPLVFRARVPHAVPSSTSGSERPRAMTRAKLVDFVGIRASGSERNGPAGAVIACVLRPERRSSIVGPFDPVGRWIVATTPPRRCGVQMSISAALVRPLYRGTKGEADMRVMVLVKASKESETGQMPNEQMLRDMGNYNEQLVKAGIMQAGEGLHPTSKAKRVRFSGPQRTVIDGPFAETKEL